MWMCTGRLPIAVVLSATLTTAAELCELVVKQLAISPDLACKFLDVCGVFGRHGVLFKMTLTGYGYTFVAKGVRASDRRVLEQEKEMYDTAYNVQDRVFPVCLGVIELNNAIPLHSYMLVRHMMLLSNAGDDVSREQERDLLPRDIDIEYEKQRTWYELYKEGVENHEVRSPNMAWNREVCRMMHFDLYRATLIPKGHKKYLREKSCAKMVDWRESVSKKLDKKQPATAKRDLDSYQDENHGKKSGVANKTVDDTATLKRMKTAE